MFKQLEAGADIRVRDALDSTRLDFAAMQDWAEGFRLILN